MAPPAAAAGSGGKTSECVRVVVRCRPLFGKEIGEDRKKILFMDPKNAVATLQKPGGEMKDAKDFTYDAVYDGESTQLGIYEDTASGIVESVMEGYNGGARIHVGSGGGYF